MGRNSANILALGWLITLLGVIGLGLTLTLDLRANQQGYGYVAGNCATGKSYYKKSDLTRQERMQFSTNAVAFELKGTSTEAYRLILDHRISGSSRDILQTKVYIFSRSIPTDLNLKLMVNGAIESESEVKANQPFYYSAKDLALKSDKSSLSVSLYSGDSCEFSSQQMLSIDKQAKYGELVKNWGDISPALPNFQKESLDLLPGENYASFDDWIYLKDSLNKGIKIEFFSPKNNKWLELDKNNAVAWPGRVYRLRNTSKKTLSVNISKNFRVPDDLDTFILEKGWNLVDIKKNTLSENKYFINPDPINLLSTKQFGLDELINNGYVKQIYRVDPGGEEKLEANENLQSLKQGRYWILLGGEPGLTLKMPNIVLDITGAGDSYSSSTVPLKFSIENKDQRSHYVSATDAIDPCQIGIRVKDRNKHIVFDDFSSKSCPLWPNLEELKIDQKKEYNYLWKVPRSFKGDYVLEVYFNYSRLPGNQIIKTSSISIK